MTTMPTSDRRRELDSLHTGGVATHLAHVLLVEPHRQAMLGREHECRSSRSYLNVDHALARLDLDRLDARSSHVRVLRERALLDRSVPGAEEKELRVAELAHRAPSDSKRVSGFTLIRLTIGFPFAARPACGISCTLSQKHRPSSVKQRM
jgi:hypothetical protein